MDSPAALQLNKQFCVSEPLSFRILLLQGSEVVLLYGTLLLFVVHLMYRIYSILWFPFFPVFILLFSFRPVLLSSWIHALFLFRYKEPLMSSSDSLQ